MKTIWFQGNRSLLERFSHVVRRGRIFAARFGAIPTGSLKNGWLEEGENGWRSPLMETQLSLCLEY